MKTLVLANVFPPQIGGSGRWLWEIYRRLPREQYWIAAGEHPKQADFDNGHQLNVVRWPLAMPGLGTANWSGMRRYMNLYRRAARMVREYDIEQIHCGTILPEGWLAWLLARRFGVPYLCYVHGEETNYIRHSRELTWMARRVLGAARPVIVNSRNTARVLQEDWQVPVERVQVMHPGVDIERFMPAARDPILRSRLGWGDRTVVLTVGRLQARKGHDRLIEALDQVRQSIPNVLYAIVGDGPEREHFETLTRQWRLENHVQFRGDVADDELVRCYQQCDLFALPNREVDGDFEGFGMVLLEAQACGRPVLAGKSGGTVETMRPGETGRLVCCDRPEPLAQALVEMLNDRERLEEMGQAARCWAVERFEWGILAEQADEVFRELSHSTTQRQPLAQKVLVSGAE